MTRAIVVFSAIALVLAFAGISFCEDPGVAGTYISKDNPREYLKLNPDGTFFLKQKGKASGPEATYKFIEGKYELSGQELKLKLADGGEASGTMKGTTFWDAGGTPWPKEGTGGPKMSREVRKGNK